MKSTMRFSVLASGSSGNVCYIETDGTCILIDAGLSCREIERRLKMIGCMPEKLDAIIVTHEHTDHIKGAGPLARRFDIPVYINRKTLEIGFKILGNLPKLVFLQTGQTLAIKDLRVETFTKCHDAIDPFGLIVSCPGEFSTFNGIRIGLATDLGRSTRLVEDRLKGCHALIMEFNYDQEMLEKGPYPLALKTRIKGQDGHLSNQQGGNLLRSVMHNDLRYVVLAHLSETNNNPKKAYDKAVDALSACGTRGASILISRQDKPSPMIEL